MGTHQSIEDLRADLDYHERMAAELRGRIRHHEMIEGIRAHAAARAARREAAGLVCDAQACPDCGECEADRLEWIDDGEVRCASCGTTFNP